MIWTELLTAKLKDFNLLQRMKTEKLVCFYKFPVSNPVLAIHYPQKIDSGI